MAVEFRGRFVTNKRNRWLINVVLILAVVAFVGFSLIPLIEAAFKGNQTQTAVSPSPVQSASAAPKKEELEAQAKGYELVLQREPENPTALRGLLEARLGLGDVKGAIAPLEKLAKLNPNETEYAILLAQAKQQTNDAEGAAQTYRDILKTKPGDRNALQGLTNLLLQQNRPEAAVGLLQDTIKTAPQVNKIQPNSVDVSSVQVILGQVYASQKRFDEAIAVFDEAAKVNKQDFRPVLGKALILKEQGKAEAAKPLFTSAAELAPAQYKDQINKLASAPSPGATVPTTTPSPAPSASPVPSP
ncbi:MAG: tetratricopeptide repeat protein [Lyngbya sp. HA4199-MV5]|jgi:tetratricopeptide (TPR) repeat protein|nr:tetratricopeptide repeat protein [Lyngbya sp. HA4199-MV5]